MACIRSDLLVGGSLESGILEGLGMSWEMMEVPLR